MSFIIALIGSLVVSYKTYQNPLKLFESEMDVLEGLTDKEENGDDEMDDNENDDENDDNEDDDNEDDKNENTIKDQSYKRNKDIQEDEESNNNDSDLYKKANTKPSSNLRKNNKKNSDTVTETTDELLKNASTLLNDDSATKKDYLVMLRKVVTVAKNPKVNNPTMEKMTDFEQISLEDESSGNSLPPKEMSKGQLKRIIQQKITQIEDALEDEGFTNSGNPNIFKLPNINVKQTMDNVMRGMKSEDFKAMKQDAKDLLDTQKQLMNTVQEYAPLVKQGQEMLTTFKDYFGSNKNKDGSKLTINGASL